MYDSFSGVTNINDPSYIDNIYENLGGFLQWALLNIGGYYNVRINATTYGQDQSSLRRVTNAPYTDGRVWEGPRRNWVWQGVSGSIQISGVYVNGTFSTATGVYPHSINYRDGQIIFSSPLPTGTTVKVEYSYNLYDIYTDRSLWFKKVLFGDWVQNYQGYLQAGSGQFDILAKNRINLPCLVVEPVNNRSFKGMQLGGGQIVNQDVLIHAIGTNPSHVSKVIDWISFLNEQKLRFYNIKYVTQAGRSPYKFDGTLNPSGLNYKNLVDNYFWKGVVLKNARLEKISDDPLYISNVRLTLEADFGEI